MMNTIKMLGIRGSPSKELERHPHRRIYPEISDRKLVVGRVENTDIAVFYVFPELGFKPNKDLVTKVSQASNC